ncbi:phenylacetate--CoA ligase family protein [Chloroflexota bacterium]
MKKSITYWNPLLETLPPEKLRQLQLAKFKSILRWSYDNSKFYRDLYAGAGLEPGDISSLDDIGKVPKVEKSMLREIQGKEPFPYGDILCVPPEKVTAYHQTSGTTGQPVYQADSWQDWELWAESWAYILCAQGYTDRDRVFLPFGYNIFIAFWSAHYGAEKLGCEVVPGGVMNTEARLLKMQELKVNAFMATPTYVLGMAETARTKLGIDPRTLNIEKITVAGEPGGSIPTTKKRMEDYWGARVYDHIGATEIGAWSYECVCQSGLHVNEALFIVEIEDLNTGELITEPDKPGKMIITNLNRTAQPCVRFDSKDIIEWSGEQCDCGRTFRTLKRGVIGRVDDITKVKGVLLAPTSIEEVVRSIPELGDEYQVVVVKKGDIDDITIKVELRPDAEAHTENVKSTLTGLLRLHTNLGYNIEFHPYGTLPRYDVKAKRFRDLRHAE